MCKCTLGFFKSFLPLKSQDPLDFTTCGVKLWTVMNHIFLKLNFAPVVKAKKAFLTFTAKGIAMKAFAKSAAMLARNQNAFRRKLKSVEKNKKDIRSYLAIFPLWEI